MKRNVLAVAALALGFAVTTSTAEAQGVTRPVTFGIGAGLSMPTGDFGDAFDSGYHGQLMLGFQAPMFPLGLRADVMYHAFEASEVDGDTKVLAGLLNATAEMGGMMASPYILGGLGMYNLSGEIDTPFGTLEADDTEFGLNIGAGMKFNLAGFSSFLEARYHHIMTEGDATAIIPITFGIMF